MKMIERMRTSALKNKEKGAITIVETLIALSVGIAVLIIVGSAARGPPGSRRRTCSGTGHSCLYPRSVDLDCGSAASHSRKLRDCRYAGLRGPQQEHVSCPAHTAELRPSATQPTISANPSVSPNLAIEVTLPPEGPTGTIDFGVFRHGEDTNDDGMFGHARTWQPSPCSTPVRKRHRAFSDISRWSSRVKISQDWLQTRQTLVRSRRSGEYCAGPGAGRRTLRSSAISTRRRQQSNAKRDYFC